MDITKYKSGYNLGLFFADMEELDDLSNRIREVLEANPQSDYSIGFSKGYYTGRAKQKINSRHEELSSIKKNKNRELTQEL
ncbi:MAG: hypothetical protein N4A72_22810 [Bacteroidales bacterium]|jgi:hypothetical protein|nr:hypothetical protein [Bacteroidales bacterium]